MNSVLLPGWTMHARRTPAAHRFEYPVLYFGFDLDELEELDARVPGLGIDRRALVSLRQADYLGGGAEPLRDRADALLAARGIPRPVRWLLVTMPRILGYVFNPVSFLYAFDADGAIAAVVAEVNNTFGETHLYVLSGEAPARPPFARAYPSPKEFHVSPFYKVEGDYEWRFTDPRDALRVDIEVSVGGRREFLATLRGTAYALSGRSLAKALLRFPATIALTMPRILVQAARLYYEKNLPVHSKPFPASPSTIRVAKPTALQSLLRAPVLKAFSRIRKGRLTLIEPWAEAQRFGGAEPGFDAVVRVLDPAFYTRVALKSDIGLGDAFMHGEFECDDLVALVRLLIDNRDEIELRSPAGRALSWAMNLTRRRAFRNSFAGARRNISYHYDLGNAFYKLFLDESMMYSCAVFPRGGESLAEAQRIKIDGILDKLDLKPTDHLLEIGTGWGALAIEAVRRSGCRVTTVTLSKEQHALARERVAAAGLASRIKVRLQDFRAIRGRFDKVVSIEMIEAIGHENLPRFFEVCDRVLRPEGIALVQAITVPDHRYDAYRRYGDWIQERVFPGAVCPSITALVQAAAKSSRLVLNDAEDIGAHYAPTLRLWREAFRERLDEVRAQGFDDQFVRLWEYYLCYCEAGFASRTLGDFQLLFTRPNNPNLPMNRPASATHDRVLHEKA